MTDINWEHAANDIGAVADRPVVTMPTRFRRPGKFTVLFLIAWLAWEAIGAVRGLTWAVPVLKWMWS
jgi:hypothetical protein